MTERTIGNYRIVRELGAGGMGAVYEGIDVMVERRVAIKMLRAEIARQPELIERFRVEAVTLAKLNHPATAMLYNFFREGEDFYMVMEFVPGRTLESLLRDAGRLAPERAADLVRQALDGMAHAHRMGVLHRDIKPANIMVTSDGHVKVTDFGIARMLGSARMTREGRIIGTLEYIAPERIRGEETDIRSDIYSAGVVLYECLAGRLPFVSDTDFALMQAHLQQAPPALGGLGVACPPALEAVLNKALAKAPVDRFQTAEEFRDALAAAAPPLMAQRPTQVSSGYTVPPASQQPTLVAQAPPPPTPPQPAPLPLDPLRTKKRLVIALSALASVLIILVGFLAWLRLRPAEPAPVEVQTQPANGVDRPVIQAPPSPPLPAELRDSRPVEPQPATAAGSLNDVLTGSGGETKPAAKPAEPAQPDRRKSDEAARKAQEARRAEALRALEK